LSRVALLRPVLIITLPRAGSVTTIRLPRIQFHQRRSFPVNRTIAIGLSSPAAPHAAGDEQKRVAPASTPGRQPERAARRGCRTYFSIR
jgi:hypothetical protein